MNDFSLDHRLKADTLEIVDWQLCRVLRMNDSNFPWLILVPRRPGARDVIDLSASDQSAMWMEVADAARALKRETRAHKLNVAALGNVVEQLHVHLIARHTTDGAWPRPVWGVAPARPFDPQAAAREVARWRRALDRP